MKHIIKRFCQAARDESGATAIEYAFIAALIFMAIVVSVRFLGNEVTNSYNDTANKVTAAAPAG